MFVLKAAYSVETLIKVALARNLTAGSARGI